MPRIWASPSRGDSRIAPTLAPIPVFYSRLHHDRGAFAQQSSVPPPVRSRATFSTPSSSVALTDGQTDTILDPRRRSPIRRAADWWAPERDLA